MGISRSFIFCAARLCNRKRKNEKKIKLLSFIVLKIQVQSNQFILTGYCFAGLPISLAAKAKDKVYVNLQELLRPQI
jgi:hypothetical protein